MKATSREQAWEMANAIFPTDYEKDEDSSHRAGYDIYRHHMLNYYSRICDLATGEMLYTVKFTAFDDTRVAGLERKQCRAIPRNSKSRSHYRYIDKIEPIENRGMQCIQVDSASHKYLVTFRKFRLNEWCNADIRWRPMDKWDACGEQIDWEDYEGRNCYCGLDLSSTGDLTALVLVFPPMGGDKKFTVLPFYWLPENVIDLRTRRDHVPYAVWKKQGVFNTTEGDVVDYEYIVAFIAKLSERFTYFAPMELRLCFRYF
jgi:hypothetical protein